MSLFENITKKVTETARAAAKKSGDLVEVTKLNMNIGAEEGKIEKVLMDIGKVVYEAYCKGDNVGDTFAEYCEKIKGLEQNIADMKQKILDLKKVKACPACGAELENEVAFCPKCGVKQEIPQPQEPVVEPKGKTCPSCGTTGEVDGEFCPQCGAKL